MVIVGYCNCACIPIGRMSWDLSTAKFGTRGFASCHQEIREALLVRRIFLRDGSGDLQPRFAERDYGRRLLFAPPSREDHHAFSREDQVQ